MEYRLSIYASDFLGDCFFIKKEYGEIFWSLNKYLTVVIILFIIAILMAYKNPTPAGMVGFDYNTYGDFVMMIVPAVVISVVAMFFSFLIYEKKINDFRGIKQICNIVSWLGKNTLVVFGFDLMINRLAIHAVSVLDANRFFVIVIKLVIDIMLIVVWNYIKLLFETKIKLLRKQ